MEIKKNNARRTRPQKAKTGRKTTKVKIEQDIKLRELFDKDGMTPWFATNQVNCGYEYAVRKFKEFGQTLTDAEEENWIERQDKVRKRALEGWSIQIKDAEKIIETVQKRLEKTRDVQESLMDKAVSEVENTELGSVIQDAIGRMDAKIVFAIYTQLSNNLMMYQNFGTLVERIQRQLKEERTFMAEMQQQYDGIEIMPPPSAVLEAEIEKSIALKNELFAPKVPQPEAKT